MLVAALGLFAYCNTFNVPFHFDDISNIVENVTITDMDYFTSPSKREVLLKHTAFRSRFVGYLSFALNYRMHGLDVMGFHITNLAIHIMNALLLYTLVMLTFRTPRIRESYLIKHSGAIALMSALLFVSHPVQTQAVTYIVQRFASLAVTFYLISLVAYAKSRLSGRKTTCIMYYALSIASAVLAMKTKQTAFTLPVMAALYEFVFFKGRAARRLLGLIPLFLTMPIIPAALIDADTPLGEIMGEADEKTRGFDISRPEYLLTEFRVIISYVRLLLLPVNQNLDYDYPVYGALLEPAVLASFLALVLVLGLGLYLTLRSRNGNEGRLVAFGIFWFFLALSVESSPIPLHVIYEHRVYLPSAGVFFSLSTAAVILFSRLDSRIAQAAFTLLVASIILALSTATLARNGTWGREVSLWEDVVRKSPFKARGYYNLGRGYGSAGKTDRAIEHLINAVELRPDYYEAHINLGVAYEQKGLIDNAIEQYRTALELGRGKMASPELNPDYSDIYAYLGVAYGKKGLINKATDHLRMAIEINPGNARAHLDLGTAYFRDGQAERAIEQYTAALELRPYDPQIHTNLGLVYKKLGRDNKAAEHFLKAKGIIR
jgi:Flp pilus assembly protein TadD